MKKNKIVFLIGIIFFIYPLNIFAQINIISPIAGTWSNKQMLVIENFDDNDFYYSIDGSDPALFGFAYDGPVLLDVTGNIELRVSHRNEKTQVNFTVNPNNAESEDYQFFIQSFMDTGIFNYTSGSILSIPKSLSYSLENSPNSFILGTDLMLSENNVISKYIPCTLLDEKNHRMWRFIIHTFPQFAGSYSRKDVPFEIKDWNTIIFTNNNYIYKIDSNYWELPKEPKTLDRTVNHMISWQSLEYEQGNPIEYFVLPTKPEIKKQITDNGAVLFYVENNTSYSMCPMTPTNTNNDFNELFSQVGIDVFYGDKVSGTLDLGLYANSVYQGTINVDYSINKRPPATPIIVSDSKGFYSRQDVHVSFTKESDSNLYIAISDPFILGDLSVSYTEDSEVFNSISLNDFNLITNPNYTINLQGIGKGAVYYKILAYTTNENNKSRTSEYSVIIDQYNFYYDQNSNPMFSDGTIEHPYTKFESCFEDISKSRSVCLRIKGDLTIPKGQNVLQSNCQIVNNGNAKLIFESGASLIIRNSSLELENIRLESESDILQTSIMPLIKLENSVCTFSDVQINGNFSKNGSAIDAFNSVVNLSNVLAAINASSYASFISSTNSRININQCNINVSGDTCVIFSLNQGTTNIKNNSLKITGKTGRIAELFSVNANIQHNSFKYQLSNDTTKFTPIYLNKSAKLKESNNEIIKF